MTTRSPPKVSSPSALPTVADPCPQMNTYTLDSMPLSVDDAHALADHAVRHGKESGQGDDIIFMPYGSSDRPTKERVVAHCDATWPRKLSEPAWSRTWAVRDGMRVVGHGDLTGGGLPAALHRCRLGMGLEREARGLGWGGRLLDELIAWARAQPSLFWLDLGVFEKNVPAQRLYLSRGFKLVGGVPDRFRVDGQQITDLQMTLAID